MIKRMNLLLKSDYFCNYKPVYSPQYNARLDLQFDSLQRNTYRDTCTMIAINRTLAILNY